MKIDSNMPVEFWLKQPALIRWAGAYMADPSNQNDYLNLRLPDKLSFHALGVQLAPVACKVIRIHATLCWRGCCFTFATDAQSAVIKWLRENDIQPNPHYPTLEELLHGRNWNSPAQNNRNSFRVSNPGAGRPSPLAAGTLGAFSGYTILSWDIAERSFPLTEAGRPSLAECLDGAIPDAELWVIEAYRARRNWQTQNPFGPESWGAPPDDSRIHIQNGEIRAIRIFFANSRELFSIHNTYFWKPHAASEGNVKKAGVFAFKDEKGALPYLYDYIRDARAFWQSFQRYKRSKDPVDRASAHEMEVRKPHLNQVDSIILGTVKLWGDVVEHEFGYRAQFAKIASLDEGFMLHHERQSTKIDISHLQRIYSAPSRWNNPGATSTLETSTYEDPFTFDYDPISMRRVVRRERPR